MPDIRHVLCPIDFSDCSRRAFDRAVAIARAQGAAVTALHVVPLVAPAPAAAVPFGPEGPGPFALHAFDRETIARQLRGFLAVGRVPDVRVAVHAVEAPSVFREILAHAAQVGADLIVMGTHGRSGFERLLIGSVTEKVLNRSMVPVLTVPASPEQAAGDTTAPFRRIVCGVDFSPSAKASLEYAAALAEAAGGALTCVHAIEILPVIYEPNVAAPFDVERYRPVLEQAALLQLHRFVPDAVRAKLAVDEVVASGKPYREVLRIAAERGADLIAIGAHGRDVLDRLLFGSTAAHVVRQATCAVLAVRAPEEARPPGEG